MSNAKHQPRHRKARRPVAALAESITSVNLSPVRPVAFASVTGLALTAVAGGAASAEPTATTDNPLAPSVVTAADLPKTVSVPDIAWTATDEVAVSAEAPAPEPAPVVEEEVSRDDVRADVTYTDTSLATYEAAVNAAGNDIVAIAMSLIGVPYVYGGTTPAGFDCSGFVQYVYAQAGISIPRTSSAQGAAGTMISYAEAQPGDLVWHAYGHVGIYAGNGMVIEATKPGDYVKIQPIWGYDAFVRF